jgi:hypothetical protein
VQHQFGRDAGGTALEEAPAGFDFLSGDAMTQLWDGDAAEMAAKKKKAAPKKKPARKPAKKPAKPRPTKNRPGCDTTDKSCRTGSR